MGAARSTCRSEPVENSLGRRRLRPQDWPRRNFAVPFDQGRDAAAAGNHDLVELPDRVGDRPIMAVDQKTLAFIVALFSMAGQVISPTCASGKSDR